MKPYNEREAVVVGIAVRKDGMDGRRRNRYRKSWLLENVIFTMATDPPTHAPPQPCVCAPRCTNDNEAWPASSAGFFLSINRYRIHTTSWLVPRTRVPVRFR